MNKTLIFRPAGVNKTLYKAQNCKKVQFGRVTLFHPEREVYQSKEREKLCWTRCQDSLQLLIAKNAQNITPVCIMNHNHCHRHKHPNHWHHYHPRQFLLQRSWSTRRKILLNIPFNSHVESISYSITISEGPISYIWSSIMNILISKNYHYRAPISCIWSSIVNILISKNWSLQSPNFLNILMWWIYLSLPSSSSSVLPTSKRWYKQKGNERGWSNKSFRSTSWPQTQGRKLKLSSSKYSNNFF